MRTTKFHRHVRSFSDEKFLTFQVSKDGLIFGNVLMPFKGSDMVFYPKPAEAPETWPPPPPKAEQIPERKEETLFDMNEKQTKSQSSPHGGLPIR